MKVICVSERPPFHVAQCEHPHNDCYCETHWYDDQPRVDCGGCA